MFIIVNCVCTDNDDDDNDNNDNDDDDANDYEKRHNIMKGPHIVDNILQHFMSISKDFDSC